MANDRPELIQTTPSGSILDLEHRLAFLERHVEIMSKEMHEQRESMSLLTKLVREVREQNRPSAIDANADVKPPHY